MKNFTRWENWLAYAIAMTPVLILGSVLTIQTGFMMGVWLLFVFLYSYTASGFFIVKNRGYEIVNRIRGAHRSYGDH